MAYGLQLYDSNQNIIFDTNTRVGQLGGRIDISGSTSGASISYYSSWWSDFNASLVGGSYQSITLTPPTGMSIWATLSVPTYNVNGFCKADGDCYISGNVIYYRVYNESSDLSYLYYGFY